MMELLDSNTFARLFWKFSKLANGKLSCYFKPRETLSLWLDIQVTSTTREGNSDNLPMLRGKNCSFPSSG